MSKNVKHAIAGVGIAGGAFMYLNCCDISNERNKGMENEDRVVEHVAVRTNKQVQLNQSYYRKFRENLANITVQAATSLPSKGSAIDAFVSTMKDPDGMQIMEHSGMLTFMLNLAADEKCAGCTDEFFTTISKLMQKEEQLKLIAEEGTKYGKQTIMNFALHHERFPAMGKALESLTLKNTYVQFGAANLVSLLAIVSSSGIPDEYQHFAWWALTNAIRPSNRDSILTQSKNILTGDQYARSKQRLISNSTMWSALFRVSSLSSEKVAESAAKFLIELSKHHDTSKKEWTPKRLSIVLKWIESDKLTLKRYAYQVLANLSERDSLKSQLLRSSMISSMLKTLRNTNDPKLLYPVLRIVSNLSNSDSTIKSPFQEAWLPVVVQGSATQISMEDSLHSESRELRYDCGWLELLLSSVQSDDHKVRTLAVQTMAQLSKHGKFSNYTQREWLALLVEKTSELLPDLEATRRVQNIKNRPRLYHGSTLPSAVHQDQIVYLRTLATMLEHQATHKTFLKFGGLSVLFHLAKSKNIEVQQQSCRLLANLCGAGTNLFAFSPIWKELVRQWTHSSNLKLRSNAIRLWQNHNFKNVRFYDGVNPIYPAYCADALDEVSAQRYQYDLDATMNVAGVDVVLLHGVLGGAFATWKDGTTQYTDQGSVDNVWPHAWLGADLNDEKLHPRILSLGYEANLRETLTAWPALTLPEQAKALHSKLVAADLGKRPIVFITHSMGGILLKELLFFISEQDTENKSILENTKGVVFLGTPHFGSPIASVNTHKVARVLLKSHPALQDLHGSDHLVQLNDRYKTFAHIKTLSIGEDLPEILPMLGTEAIVVPPASSNPGIGTFVHLENSCHTDICKPKSRRDPRYVLIKAFILSQLC